MSLEESIKYLYEYKEGNSHELQHQIGDKMFNNFRLIGVIKVSVDNYSVGEMFYLLWDIYKPLTPKEVGYGLIYKLLGF